MPSIYEYKFEYNKLLARERKAEAFLNDNKIPLDEREKWKPEYLKIITRLNELLVEIKFYTPQNILEGFPEAECTRPDSKKIKESLDIKRV